ncbi:hypothetical protein GEMRC1_007139 [Eukaryota sp. GEM-RC1]
MIGIDLGTTNSLVAICDDNGPRIVSDRSNKVVQSVVSFHSSRPKCGKLALRDARKDPEKVVTQVKRFIGRRLDIVSNPSDLRRNLMEDNNLARELRDLPYEIDLDAQNRPSIMIDKDGDLTHYTPEFISAVILQKLQSVAAKATGQQSFPSVYITIPYEFDERQRKATKDAAIIAGFENPRLVCEPTAAAVAFLYYHPSLVGKRVLIFDLGGGTFDLCLAHLTSREVQVIHTGGDRTLGGSVVDRLLVDYFKTRVGHGLEKSDLECLRQVVEEAKCYLSQVPQHSFSFLNSQLTLTQQELRTICAPFSDRVFQNLDQFLELNRISPRSVDNILLVGGSTLLPGIAERLSSVFPGVDLLKRPNCDEAVALGASILANDSHHAPVLNDVLGSSIVTPVHDGLEMVLQKGSSLRDCRAEKTFTTTIHQQKDAVITIMQGTHRPEKAKMIVPISELNLEENIDAKPRYTNLKYRYVLVIDRSTSMRCYYSNLTERLYTKLSSLDEKSSFCGAILFDRRVTTVKTLSELRRSTVSGSTDIIKALNSTADFIQSDYSDSDRSSTIVYRILLVSDGHDNNNNDFKNQFSQQTKLVYDKLKTIDAKFEVTTLGIGSDFPTHVCFTFRSALRGEEGSLLVPPLFQAHSNSEVNDKLDEIFDRVYTPRTAVVLPDKFIPLKPRLLPWNTQRSSVSVFAENYLIVDDPKGSTTIDENTRKFIVDAAGKVNLDDLTKVFQHWNLALMSSNDQDESLVNADVRTWAKTALKCCINLLSNHERYRTYQPKPATIYQWCSNQNPTLTNHLNYLYWLTQNRVDDIDSVALAEQAVNLNSAIAVVGGSSNDVFAKVEQQALNEWVGDILGDLTVGPLPPASAGSVNITVQYSMTEYPRNASTLELDLLYSYFLLCTKVFCVVCYN